MKVSPAPVPRAYDLEQCKAFVLAAQKAYANGAGEIIKAADGRKLLVRESKEFKLTDEFDGGSPFCGVERLISKRENHIVWSGYYHGWLTVETDNAKVVFDFLRDALAHPDGAIFRGPRTFASDQSLHYRNTLEFGAFDCFFGSESITDEAGRTLYFGKYGGGFVDLSEDVGEAN